MRIRPQCAAAVRCCARQKKAVEDLMLKEIELEEAHRLLKVPLTTPRYRAARPSELSWKSSPPTHRSILRQPGGPCAERECYGTAVPLRLVGLRTSRACTHARACALVCVRVRARLSAFLCAWARAREVGLRLRIALTRLGQSHCVP